MTHLEVECAGEGRLALRVGGEVASSAAAGAEVLEAPLATPQAVVRLDHVVRPSRRQACDAIKLCISVRSQLCRRKPVILNRSYMSLMTKGKMLVQVNDSEKKKKKKERISPKSPAKHNTSVLMTTKLVADTQKSKTQNLSTALNTLSGGGGWGR